MSNYNATYDKNSLQHLDSNLDFQNNFICSKDLYKMRTHFAIQDSKNTLEANYEKAKLKKAMNKSNQLNTEKQSLIVKIRRTHKRMFDGMSTNEQAQKMKFSF